MKKKLSDITRLALIYICCLIVGTLIFFLLLWSPIIKDNNDLFFRVVFLMLGTTALIMTFLTLIKLKYQRNNSHFTYRDVLLICLLFFFINWNVYGMIPFNVSRSNSIIILDYLYKNQGKPLSKGEIKTYTQKKYFEEYDSVGMRLHEQLKAGNITLKNERFLITERGVLVANIFRNISGCYNLNNSFLETTDTPKKNKP